jgi:nucleotide-binding universal stress UspA family protein
MYRSILVPLDGSILAEQAILPAGEMARRLDARLALAVVHPWSSTENAPFAGSDLAHQWRREEIAYLEELRERVREVVGVDAAIRLLEHDPFAALVEYARERDVDLVVASTRCPGRGAAAPERDLALRVGHALACPTLLVSLAAGIRRWHRTGKRATAGTR